MNLAPFLCFLYRKRKEKIMSLDGIIDAAERYSREVNSLSFNLFGKKAVSMSRLDTLITVLPKKIQKLLVK